MGKVKRDSDYYMRRLETEHPSIFADWQAGRYPSARKALEAAGLRTPTKALGTLKNAWAKATIEEQKHFVQWFESTRPAAPVAIVDSDSLLLPATAARINTIKSKRGLEVSDIMTEMGMRRRDTSLSSALGKPPTRIKQPELIEALAKWLEENRKVV